MQEHPQAKYNHYLVALFLGVAGVLILLVFVSLRSQADTNQFSATISNATPTVDSITINTSTSGADFMDFNSSSPLVLNEYNGTLAQSTTSLYVYGTITDNNGCFEVTSSTGGKYQVYAYRYEGPTCFTSSTDRSDLNCYINSSNNTNDSDDLFDVCEYTSGCTPSTTVSVNYLCTIPIKHFADATDSGGLGTYASQSWIVEVAATDTNGARSTTGTKNVNYKLFELATLTALNVSSSLDFGSIAYGTASHSVGSMSKSIRMITSGNNASTTITVSGFPSFNCTVGSILIGSLGYSTVSNGTQIVSTTASGVAFTRGVNAIKYGKQQASTTEAVSTTYWLLDAVSNTAAGNFALGGTCNGTLTFTAS